MLNIKKLLVKNNSGPVVMVIHF